MARHALVVGGTGMLAGVVHELTRRGWEVTVIARGRERHERVARQAPAPGHVHPLPLDYRDDAALVTGVREAQAARGPFEVVVAWIHGTAPRAHERVAAEVGHEPPTCRYLEVLGSAGANPSAIEVERAATLARLPFLDHCRVVLGFVVEPPSSRWLTDSEISGGTLAALDSGARQHVVGTLEPWSARP